MLGLVYMGNEGFNFFGDIWRSSPSGARHVFFLRVLMWSKKFFCVFRMTLNGLLNM